MLNFNIFIIVKKYTDSRTLIICKEWRKYFKPKFIQNEKKRIIHKL